MFENLLYSNTCGARTTCRYRHCIVSERDITLFSQDGKNSIHHQICYNDALLRGL
jgi:hypothetical protein